MEKIKYQNEGGADMRGVGMTDIYGKVVTMVASSASASAAVGKKVATKKGKKTTER